MKKTKKSIFLKKNQRLAYKTCDASHLIRSIKPGKTMNLKP
jgi:hypothetical protein